MVRKVGKVQGGEEQLKELEEITDKEVIEFKEKQKKILDEELDTGYYFSVIFETREERDEWLNKHGIVLMDNYSVKAEHFIEKIN